MTDTTNKWLEIESAIERHKALNLSEAIDYDKFYLYSIITHSTAIEGSTLTEIETQILFDDGLTAKGKPLTDHLMNRDLKDAYFHAVSEADKKTPITPEFLKLLNSKVMKSTGGEHNVIAGTFDSSKGEFRLCGVQAGYNGKSYVNFRKVPGRIDTLCDELNKQLPGISSLPDIYHSSFDAHLDLVTIHPWIDGNGRTSRLLMNYIQFCRRLPPVKIHRQDKAGYMNALKASQDTKNHAPFREFMADQLLKTLREEIEGYEQSQKHWDRFTLMF
jgi:Fic family protein